MKKVLFIVGPTAAGKTECAIRAAEAFQGEIVSCDSVQLYRRMDIGSAKPTEAERKRAVHWFVDAFEPEEPLSVAEYQTLAKAKIAEIQNRGNLPIVTGGTGLYVNSLLFRMDFGGKEGDVSVRTRLEREAEEKGGAVLFARLSKLDPVAASRIEEGNVRKVVRALELLETTGKTLLPFEEAFVPTDEYEPILIGITRPRSELIERIDRRVDAMFDAGLVREVEMLLESGLPRDAQPMQAIGYKEIVQAIDGFATDVHGEFLPPASPEAFRSAKERIKIHTRQYAKRQVTWFKRLPGIVWLSPEEEVIGALRTML